MHRVVKVIKVLLAHKVPQVLKVMLVHKVIMEHKVPKDIRDTKAIKV